MGIVKLLDFFRKKCPSVFHAARDVDHAMRIVRELPGGEGLPNAICVDVSVLMHKIIHGKAKGAGVEEVAQQFVKYASYFTMNGRHVYFVFDGAPNQLKAGHEKVKRDERRAKTQQRITSVAETKMAVEHEIATSADSSEKAELRKQLAVIRQEEKRLTQSVVRPTRHHYDHVWLALKGMKNVSVCQSRHDGEAGCVALAKSGKVALCISTDTDLLAYGAPFCMLEFETAKDRMGTVFSLQEVLSAMSMTYETFVEFCILCGCDFTPKLAGIGNAKAETIIRKHGSIERYIASLPQSKRAGLDDFLWKESKELFMNPDLPDVEREVSATPAATNRLSILLDGVVSTNGSGVTRIADESLRAIRERVERALDDSGETSREQPSEQPSEQPTVDTGSKHDEQHGDGQPLQSPVDQVQGETESGNDGCEVLGLETVPGIAETTAGKDASDEELRRGVEDGGEENAQQGDASFDHSTVMDDKVEQGGCSESAGVVEGEQEEVMCQKEASLDDASAMDEEVAESDRPQSPGGVENGGEEVARQQETSVDGGDAMDGEVGKGGCLGDPGVLEDAEETVAQESNAEHDRQGIENGSDEQAVGAQEEKMEQQVSDGGMRVQQPNTSIGGREDAGGHDARVAASETKEDGAQSPPNVLQEAAANSKPPEDDCHGASDRGGAETRTPPGTSRPRVSAYASDLLQSYSSPRRVKRSNKKISLYEDLLPSAKRHR